jgi:transcriptional regulator NrdR family protein
LRETLKAVKKIDYINRFNSKYNQFLGYQTVNESLQRLRLELRYGKNAPDNNAIN